MQPQADYSGQCTNIELFLTNFPRLSSLMRAYTFNVIQLPRYFSLYDCVYECVAYTVYLLKRSRCKGVLSSIWCRVLSGLDPWRVAGAPL